ncbi:MAG: SusD/RagB family nutrient-binding outer membrane lipoprotein [Fulvivirga sp.]|nr:SusD/RagB family nutrient-binding outer membrane lipoprotein [Fulvivirga sp.]
MKKLIYIISLTFLMVACTDEVLDINQNPNLATEAEIDLLLTGAQVGAGFWTNRNANEAAMILTRQMYGLAFSQYNIGPDNINNDFNALYSSVLKEFERVIQQGAEEDNRGAIGIAQVYKAYLFGIMVDLWGDIPYSEALNGEENPFPAFDDDAQIYDQLLLLLDEAKVNLDTAINRGTAPAAGDVVYGGDYSMYKKVANTVKLKLLLNLRLTDPGRATSGIEDLIAENDFIDENSENFVFRYGTTISPLNQNPIYQQEYTGSGNKTFYMDNYFMWKLYNKDDPRLPYYIYRQGTNSELTFETTPCSNRTDCTYATLLLEAAENDPQADGLIGRDHGDPSGIPGDNTVRATWGVYPIGGLYDNNTRSAAVLGTGANGGGIMPWLTAAMTHFMLAEAALTLATGSDDPATLLEAGIDLSMEHVFAEGAALSPNAPAATNASLQDDKDTYITGIINDYNNASDNGKLNIIIEEKYFAEFGNGFEAYNDLRRTGSPNDLPESLVPLGPFLNRYPYGRTELTTNPNAPDPAPLVTEKVF